MAETWNKKEREKKKQQNKKEKEERKLERKNNATSNGSYEVPFAYVDENGNLTSEPPDGSRKKVIKAEDIVIGVPQAIAADDNIRNGVVKFYNETKGFGFIRDVDTKKEYFVHLNNIIDKISEQSRVTFEIQRGPKGEFAANVKLLS